MFYKYVEGKKNQNTKNKLQIAAFTLTEVLVVLIIIGVLILLAMPNLLPLITKAKSTEAKVQLQHAFTLQKNYFFEYSKYSEILSDIGFEQQKLVNESGEANYKIETLFASSTTFKIRATAVVDFDGDGVFNVWEIDQDQKLTEITPD
jgi:type IV pilus assembly protein PilE